MQMTAANLYIPDAVANDELWIAGDVREHRYPQPSLRNHL